MSRRGKWKGQESIFKFIIEGGFSIFVFVEVSGCLRTHNEMTLGGHWFP